MTSIKSYWKDKQLITLTNEQISKLALVQKKQHIALGIILSGFPIFVFVAVLAEFTAFAPALFLLYMMVFAYAGILISKQKCPYCHNNFFWSWGWKNPLANKCVHCGLGLHETDNQAHVYKTYVKKNNE